MGWAGVNIEIMGRVSQMRGTDSPVAPAHQPVGFHVGNNPGSVGWRDYLRMLGPGVVGGASDTDPTTVATMVIIGADTMYGLAWMALLLLPVIAIIQAISTQVGVASHRDLQTAVTESRGKTARWLLLFSVLTVNIVTIAADLEAGSSAIGMLLHRDWRWFVAPLSLLLIGVLLILGYHVVQRAMKYLLICLLAYAVAAVFAHPDWGAVLHGTLVPHFEWNTTYTSDAMSLIGTTMTSYVYVWQTIGQAEERIPWRLHRARQIDALLGSVFAVAVFWFILIATGATLGVHHLHADTPQEAAAALVPIAGPMASDLFAFGLLISAVVALPVIMATTAYATGAHLNWRRGLSLSVREAPLFYSALAVSILVGAAAAYCGIPPIRLLYIAGIIGAIGTPIGLSILLQVGADRRIMRGHPISPRMRAAGWLITFAITAVGAVYLVRLFFGV